MIRNHNILLKDTSEAEMTRFRQIMLGIWRQQIEDDKNAKVIENSFADYQLNSNTNLISIRRVAQSIKKHLGQIHKPMAFNNLIGEEPYPFSIPMNAENLIYDDSQGNKKSGVILLKWLSFKGINLKPETFKASIEIGDEHTDFTLTIFQDDLEKIAFKLTMHDFDLFMALFVELGIRYTDIGNHALIALYRKKIKEANDNPDKLDVIYQSYPKILFGKGDDAERYKHLDLILKSMYRLGGSAGTNEDKAILQILYAMNDRRTLYTILGDSDSGLLFEIYKKLQGEEVQDLLRFLTRLVEEFDNSKPTPTVYFDNSYYLFRDTHVKTEWIDGNISLSNYKDETKMILTKEHKNPTEIYAPEYYIKNKSFNPLAKLNFGTKLGDLGEQVGDENTFVIALKLHNMATKQSNWDLFNIATDLLSLLSAYGALRLVLAKGAPIAVRALAGLTLAKDAAHYTMLSEGTLEKLHANGYSWLAQLWVAFSVTVDLASFGLPNLSKIAREGNVAAELAETVEEAREIRRITNEANRIIETETGRDVTKMTKEEYEDFFDHLSSKWEGKPVSGITKTSRGAKKLSKKEIKAYIKKINVISNGKSELIILPRGHELFVRNNAAASFNAADGNIYVQKGVTDYELFHEFKHFEEYKKIGKEEYMKGMKVFNGDPTAVLIRKYKREKYVFDEIMKNKTRFNEKEIEHANWYINTIIKECSLSGIDVTKIK
ncbi:zincin-like metallopeptidase toxin domain-containing protein [Flavobacterium artemisiae]|uniref:Zincin-like metallopeptidase toxin domain-containing protein n=1 Tax=Flavobacterium artemisiae TaxID=2126556 RepID=A0ABW4HG30_9FLAO